MDGVATVLFYSSLAAVAAAAGAVPFSRRRVVPAAWLGWANALAAGLMLGAAYVLTTAGLRLAPLVATAASGLGIGFVHWAHRLSQTAELGLHWAEHHTIELSRRVTLRSVLHSSAEGLAIGAGMLLNQPLGIFLALAFAVHNVPEGMTLAAVLRGRGIGVASAALRCVAVNGGQVALAVVAFVLGAGAPALLPWLSGFAAGALVYLVLVELLPDSYHQAGHTSIAVIASLAIGALVLLERVVGAG